MGQIYSSFLHYYQHVFTREFGARIAYRETRYSMNYRLLITFESVNVSYTRAVQEQCDTCIYRRIIIFHNCELNSN